MNDAVLEADFENLALSTDTERRRGLRIHQARPIKVFEPTACRYFGGQTEDISATGLRIELPRSVAITVGKVVSIHIGLNERGEALANRRQMVPARVVWVRREFGVDRPLLSAGLELISSMTAHQDAA
jgi:hypothetical protein